MEIYDRNVIELLHCNPEIHSLTEVDELHDKRIVEFNSNLFYSGNGKYLPHYRSEQCYGWDIVPGIFRNKSAALTTTEAKNLERKAIIEFERVVKIKLGAQTFRDLFEKKPNGKNWDLLFQAQHGGIRTTLVDWTMYIQRAIFFGVEESIKSAIESADAQLWVFLVPEPKLLNDSSSGHKESFHDHNPFTIDKGFMVNVPVYLDNLEERIYERRISRQGGRFYISPSDICNSPMNKQANLAPLMFRFKIPAKYKSIIRDELNNRGVNRETIYVKENPDHQIWINQINLDVFGY